MKTIDQLADELAEKYHKGQKRKDGSDYITHPRAMARMMELSYNPQKSYGTGLPLGQELPLLKAACLTHDVLEDCNVTNEELRKEFLKEFEPWVVNSLVICLHILNRNNYLSYQTYIIAIKHAGLFPTTVKLEDLEHNSSTLPSGSLKDKYELSTYILTR